MAKKKSATTRGEITDVDGILKRAEADRRAANQQQRDPYEPPWGWGRRAIFDEPPSSTTRDDSPAQRAAERYVAGSRPVPLNPKSARERKAARQQQNAGNKKQASRKKP